ncbi:MAG: DDE-type integrase/transposase/recombinase [Nanoarchaeota archaeon]|nr:DDE-type integrase/transposase/recombinase [Nanoarchaeota archaeon]
MKCENRKQKEYKKVICPNCSSTSIIKRGKRKTDNRGLIQRYGCKDCSKRFVKDEGFWKMKNNPHKVTLCLDLFYRGISTRKVQEHLQAFYPQNSSNVSIYKWIVKYSKMIHGFTNNLKINCGEEVQFDEMEYGKKGKKNHGWFIDAIDTKTRFMVSSDFAKSRGKKEIKKVIAKAKEKTGKQIKVYTTDGFTAYYGVIKSVVGYYELKKGNIKHNKVTQLKGEGFNHKVERLHSNIRARTKTFRGFGSVEGANAIMKGFEVYYNFIRKHQAINCCPYELALPNLKLENPNKWLELIRLAVVKPNCI